MEFDFYIDKFNVIKRSKGRRIATKWLLAVFMKDFLNYKKNSISFDKDNIIEYLKQLDGQWRALSRKIDIDSDYFRKNLKNIGFDITAITGKKFIRGI